MERVMHVSLPIGKPMLLGIDTSCEWASSFKQGNNFSVSINIYTKLEADRLFNELAADGVVMMPMENSFWGSYFGMFTDKFGIQKQ